MTAHPIGDVLSVTTGRLVSRDHMDGIYRVCDYMTGTSNFTHQLGRVSEEVTPAILEQHPWLANITVPKFASSDTPEERQAAVYGWLESVEAEHGPTVELTPLACYEGRNPLTELVEMAGDTPVIAVVAED